ncbi:hypothetical protein [Rhizobium leguminosarum]|uniref:hypothetical protein n=1 Tax=Rhizobium leguminosarum TaxID=384 RepID=UPI001C964698|nr:hypothetical protein [Rhizobium leguminosarum]MBY5666324.1 hypothetical protein [Rhizobium leguminosarum]MBY5679912.1 hypothetical protein [Rhizobium leguminosarum]
MQLTEVFLWIESIPAVRFISTAPVIYPVISALHLMGIALLFGSIIAVDLRLLGVVGPQFDPVLQSLVRLAVFGFLLAAISGALLASIRITDYAENPAFLIKLSIVFLAGVNALVLRLKSITPGISESVGRPYARIAGAISVFLWTGAVLAGRWIAFI